MRDETRVQKEGTVRQIEVEVLGELGRRLGWNSKSRAQKCETGDGEASSGWDRTEMEIDNAIPSPRVAPRYYALQCQGRNTHAYRQSSLEVGHPAQRLSVTGLRGG